MAFATRRTQAGITWLVVLVFVISLAEAAPAGSATELILPGVVVAGEPATLGVLIEGRPAAGVTVEFDDGQKVLTDANGHGHFSVPTGRMVVTARVGEVAATAPVLAAAAALAAERPEIERVSRLLALGERTSVRGRGFDGQAERNRVVVGASEAHVLAASPVALVIAPPANAAPGTTELSVETRGGRSNTRPVTLLALEIAAPAKLQAGEKVRPQILIRGTRERVEVEVTNRSPNILRLTGGRELRVLSSGGEPNVVELKARALAAGSFAITARVIAPPGGEPDREFARLLLDRARQLTDNAQIQERIAWMLVQLERQPTRPAVITREINRVLGSFPLTVPLGKTLEAARDALEGR